MSLRLVDGGSQLVVAFLAKHPKVATVHLPGPCHSPAAPFAANQMGQRYDGMVTAVLKGGLPASKRVLKWFKLFTLTESLGGVESLIEIRRSGRTPRGQRTCSRVFRIAEGLVRLSVGSERIDALLAELEEALS